MEKISLILLTAFVFLSSGCSTSAPMKKEEENKADLRNYEKEIDQLLNSANSSQIENPDIIKLRAANIASKAKDYETVGRILTIIKDPSKNDGIRLNYSILKAEKALYDKEPAKAITILKGLSEIEGGEITIAKLKAKAYELIGSHIASARELISINSLLPAPSRKSNQEAILSRLLFKDNDSLIQAANESISFEIRGWILLASLVKRYEDDLLEQKNAFDTWRKNWPKHPASLDPPKRLQLLTEMMDKAPKNIALILPLSGNFAKFGEAIRDGFITAHYESTGNKKIKIYDSSSDDIMNLVNRAIINGAEIIVGPLAREKVKELSRNDLPTRVLALNRTDNKRKNSKLYQFGLAPEDESIQVATKTFNSGYRRALVIAPQTEWGDRNYRAFTKKFEELGGEIADSARFTTQKDYSSLVKSIFQIGYSEERSKTISRLIGEKLEFKARRRKDIDFVFLLASTTQARGINPTLSFFYGEDLPVYSTSNVNQNREDRLRNIDLNGIYFCEMPWKLSETNKLQLKIMESWPEKSATLTAFFALGADAHKVIQRLTQLEEFPDERIAGGSGILEMNENKVITRTLFWANFENAKIKTSYTIE